jgi:chromosome segregation ATPase
MRNRKVNPHKQNQNKEKSEVEHLKGVIRDLEKQVKSLTQKLKYFEKRSHLNELTEELENDPPPPPKRLKDCVECGKGKYEEFELLNKLYGTCNICGDRKRLK